MAANVAPAGACILLSFKAIDYGALTLSSPTQNVSKEVAGPTVTNCSGRTQRLSVRGTDASGTGSPPARWTLVDIPPTDTPRSTPTCRLGPNQYGHRVATPRAKAALSTSDSPLGVLTPSAAVATTATLFMPCVGSGGAGQTMGMEIIFTGT